MKILLFILALSLLSCRKSDKSAEVDNKIIEELFSSHSIDPDLWKVKLVEKQLIQTNHKLTEELKCNQYSLIYTIDLKKDCFQSKSIFDNNSITAEIKKVFAAEDDAFEVGNCFTQEDVDSNIEKWKKDRAKMLGTTVCQGGYKHLLLGGGCENEVTMTKEMLEEDAEVVKQKAQDSLRNQTHLKKGHSFLKRTKVEVCENSAEKFTAKTIED